MFNKIWKFFIILVTLAFILTACGSAAVATTEAVPTPTPSASPFANFGENDERSLDFQNGSRRLGLSLLQ